MHFNIATGAVTLTAVATTAMAMEMPKDTTRAAELYDSGKLHAWNMERKIEMTIAQAEAGMLNSTVWPRLNYTKCEDGVAQAIPGDPLHGFKCKNIDLYDFINHATLGSPNGYGLTPDSIPRTGSSTWGWIDPESGREFIANGMVDGTAFIEILPEGRMSLLGFLPVPVPIERFALWKEVRSYKHYMLIGSEMVNHGVQIFDMTKLLDIDPEAPVKFDPVRDVTGHFTDLPGPGRSHNIVVYEEKDLLLVVGSQPRTDECRSGLILVDLSDISNPTKIGCNPNDGYVHDAQCLTYKGPDEKYLGRDVCYSYNEDTLTIYDVTDPANSSIISVTSYEGATYTHQGWVLDPEWQEFLILDDELDEVNSVGAAQDGYPVTFIWQLESLESPKQVGLYKGSVRSVDHNQYIKDGLTYQSNYQAGLRVYDISSIPTDPSGNSVCEVAYFDIHPEDDNEPGGGVPTYEFGTWAAYAMFPSGFIFINTKERGAFLVKMTRRESCPNVHPCNADNCLRAMRSTSVEGRLEESQEFCGAFLSGWSADVGEVPAYGATACGENIISRVSSACSCLPTPTSI
ncbi:hypothetical protein B0I35DRAFT_454867 [Stachybotrys elegans]|uniref:Uncharacterized protein n=1 Tax=Stachybotrys elegans TaxID=80388 RepID=A0A8K0SH11_9HYPO|nr:hypothetical protein B0I35DRAFT_454867 [Stachybotrys elegans]